MAKAPGSLWIPGEVIGQCAHCGAALTGEHRCPAFNPVAIPQPPPVAGKIAVLPLVIADLEARSMMGTAKYGTALLTHNGRAPLLDAYQECCDLLMYLKQALLEQSAPCGGLPFAFALGQQVRWVAPSDIPAVIATRQHPFQVRNRTWSEGVEEVTGEWYLIRPVQQTGDWMQDRPVRVHRTALVAWETPAEERHDG
jgi:hypothetical protein